MSKVFYKYRAMDEHSKDLIKNGEFYFANPLQFNDPFDCKFSVSLNGSRLKQKRYFRRMLKTRMPNKSKKFIKQLTEDLYLSLKTTPEKFISNYDLDFKKFISEVGIYSMSEINDSILMWSHYACNHRGFCLELTNLPGAIEVQYEEKYPTVNRVTDNPLEQYKKSFFTKAPQWSYEREWRLVDFTNGFGPKRIAIEKISGVIFGCRMSEEHKSKIVEWCGDRSNRMSFYEARQSNSKYSLDIVNI